MATSPGHTGTCGGKGLQHRGWHGYIIKVDESDQLQEVQLYSKVECKLYKQALRKSMS